jgi:hypothetical protein
MSQMLEQQTLEGIGSDGSMRAGSFAKAITCTLRASSPEANARLCDPLPCGHPRACLYPDYCPPDKPEWKFRTDHFCTACQQEASAIAEARSEALEEAYQECWVSRNSDEIADAILALLMDDEKP